MFKERDWVKPAEGVLRLSGIDVENIYGIQVTEVFSSSDEIECVMYINKGRSLRATFTEDYVVHSRGKEEYSLTF